MAGRRKPAGRRFDGHAERRQTAGARTSARAKICPPMEQDGLYRRCRCGVPVFAWRVRHTTGGAFCKSSTPQKSSFRACSALLRRARPGTALKRSVRNCSASNGWRAMPAAWPLPSQLRHRKQARLDYLRAWPTMARFCWPPMSRSPKRSMKASRLRREPNG